MHNLRALVQKNSEKNDDRENNILGKDRMNGTRDLADMTHVHQIIQLTI